jgi:hypothetical protein
MDACKLEYGYVDPIHLPLKSYVGCVVYIDKDGSIKQTDSLYEEVEKIFHSCDTIKSEYPFQTVAFTTGYSKVEPIIETEFVEESRNMRNGNNIDEGIVPEPTNLGIFHGWRVTKDNDTREPADVIIIGPGVTKTNSKIEQDIVKQWAQAIPRKYSLWSAKRWRRVPKSLIVLEEWTTSAWFRDTLNSETVAADFTVHVTDGDAPVWSLSKTTSSDKCGNLSTTKTGSFDKCGNLSTTKVRSKSCFEN